MKQCRQCLKERETAEFRVANNFTYHYCIYCETLNKKFAYLHKKGRTDTDEYNELKETMLELQRRGGTLIKQVEQIIFGTDNHIKATISKVLEDI